jgi:hypothetical protein
MVDLEKDFPSLKLGYEQIKDVLREQATITQNYISRAITLFAIATAVIGIGLPLLFTGPKLSYTNLILHVPVICWAVLPLLIYAIVIFISWSIIRPSQLKTISSPKILQDEGYLQLEPGAFYSELIQDITENFNENEIIIERKEKDLIWLSVFVFTQTMFVVMIVLLFFAFGFFG